MTLKEVAREMAAHGVSGMPVLDEELRVVGVISDADPIARGGPGARGERAPSTAPRGQWAVGRGAPLRRPPREHGDDDTRRDGWSVLQADRSGRADPPARGQPASRPGGVAPAGGAGGARRCGRPLRAALVRRRVGLAARAARGRGRARRVGRSRRPYCSPGFLRGRPSLGRLLVRGAGSAARCGALRRRVARASWLWRTLLVALSHHAMAGEPSIAREQLADLLPSLFVVAALRLVTCLCSAAVHSAHATARPRTGTSVLTRTKAARLPHERPRHRRGPLRCPRETAGRRGAGAVTTRPGPRSRLEASGRPARSGCRARAAVAGRAAAD
jgi:hypothetical protein